MADVTRGRYNGKIGRKPRLKCTGKTRPLGQPKRLSADPLHQKIALKIEAFAPEVWYSFIFVLPNMSCRNCKQVRCSRVNAQVRFVWKCHVPSAVLSGMQHWKDLVQVSRCSVLCFPT